MSGCHTLMTLSAPGTCKQKSLSLSISIQIGTYIHPLVKTTLCNLSLGVHVCKTYLYKYVCVVLYSMILARTWLVAVLALVTLQCSTIYLLCYPLGVKMNFNYDPKNGSCFRFLSFQDAILLLWESPSSIPESSSSNMENTTQWINHYLVDKC